MDGQRFDDAVKAFANRFTRRNIGRGLLGGLGATLLPARGAGAKRKGRGAGAGKKRRSKGRRQNRGFRRAVQDETIGVTTFSVLATQPWTDTGIDLPPNARVGITASGRIKIAGSDPGKFPDGTTFAGETPQTRCDAVAVTPNAACVSLIGRVAGGPPFPVGFGTSFTTTAGGRLELGVNDSVFGDNSGSWTATVTVSVGEWSVAPIPFGEETLSLHRRANANPRFKAVLRHLCGRPPKNCKASYCCGTENGGPWRVSHGGAHIRDVYLMGDEVFGQSEHTLAAYGEEANGDVWAYGLALDGEAVQEVVTASPRKACKKKKGKKGKKCSTTWRIESAVPASAARAGRTRARAVRAGADEGTDRCENCRGTCEATLEFVGLADDAYTCGKVVFAICPATGLGVLGCAAETGAACLGLLDAIDQQVFDPLEEGACELGCNAVGQCEDCSPRQCGPNEFWDQDFCRCSCQFSPGIQRCGGACVDTRSSRNHCGSCGSACAAGQDCVGSQCVGGGCGADGASCGTNRYCVSGSCVDYGFPATLKLPWCAGNVEPRRLTNDWDGTSADPHIGAGVALDFGRPPCGPAVKGTLVLAPVAGAVRKVPNSDTTLGNYVDIDPGNGWVVRLAHLDAIDATLGDTVRVGDPVGTLGDSGLVGTRDCESGCPHIHADLFISAGGRQHEPDLSKLTTVFGHPRDAFDCGTGGCGNARTFTSTNSHARCPAPSCPAGQTPCGEVCVNLKTNRDHCGCCSQPCGAGQACANGECVAGQCNASTCGGCCAGGVCRQGDTDASCGRGGAACVTCAAGQKCQGGVCQNLPGDNDVVVCSLPNYGGTCETFRAVSFDLNLANNTIGDNTISSLKVGRYAIARLFADANCIGRQQGFTDFGNGVLIPDLTGSTIGDNAASSIGVGRWDPSGVYQYFPTICF